MKWLMQNLRNRSIFALRNPLYAARAIMGEITRADETFIAQITGTSPRRVRAFMNEPISTPKFAAVLRKAEPKLRNLSFGADLFAKKVLIQYAAVRALAPQCVVETGLANGVSSSYLLLALEKNGKGILHTIGLNDPAFLPPGEEPGWMVPEWLRQRWRVHIGDARKILPSLLPQLDCIDVFIHDSLHTYEQMSWEFEAAYPFLRPAGLLVSDDALWNDAFHDFALKANEQDARILRGVGFLRKNRLEAVFSNPVS